MSKDAPKMAIRTKAEPLSTRYTVMFDVDIEESSEFHENWYVMEQACENDIVDVCISSLGGSVTTISKFQDIVKNSEAHFHGKLQGYGYSAGGALFLLCDTQEVSDLATFMAHSIQSGYSGGSQALEAHSTMSSKHNRTLCEMLYKDFLSEGEINRICDGAEIWMDADEIRERLAKRDEIRDKRATEELKETYTEQAYAEQVLADILEDCEQLGYDVYDIIREVTHKAEMNKAEKVDSLLPEACTPVWTNDLTIEGVKSTPCIDTLKLIAHENGIKFVHNIGTEKLRERVIEHLENLNK